MNLIPYKIEVYSRPILDTLLGGSKTTTTQQQQTVHTGEVFGLWQHLVQRYDIRELTDFFKTLLTILNLKQY